MFKSKPDDLKALDRARSWYKSGQCANAIKLIGGMRWKGVLTRSDSRIMKMAVHILEGYTYRLESDGVDIKKTVETAYTIFETKLKEIK